MEYKGYTAVIEYSPEDRVFHGHVEGIRDVVTFEGNSVASLERAFRDSVDDYLEFCAERGKKPEKPYSGTFTLRVSPDVHRQAATAAARERKSLNTWVTDRIRESASSGRYQPHGKKTKR